MNDEKELVRTREILIPYPVAKARYASYVASISDHLNESKANDAKDKGLEQFRWYLKYSQPDDPKTKDKDEFLRLITKSTKVFLVCRGFKWKSSVEINSETPLPEQIRSRYEERARLLCSQEPIETVPVATAVEERKVLGRSLGDDVDIILKLLANLRTYSHVDIGYIDIIELALRKLKSRKR